MNLPKFITFTGVDVHTDVAGMVKLSAQYPIEWGILLSPKRQGEGRYPCMDFIRDVALVPGLTRLSAHLCGGHTRDLVDRRNLPLDVESLLAARFGRAQINGAPVHTAGYLARWGAARNMEVILQCPARFPDNAGVSWLLDGSGGRGISPKRWPAPPDPAARVGYAGGLNQRNVCNAVAKIGAAASNYWIDMESGVRDGNDRFDLGLCRAVCEEVYGSCDDPTIYPRQPTKEM